MTRITDLPKDERPREKLLQRGAGSLSDAELLAIFDLGTIAPIGVMLAFVYTLVLLPALLALLPLRARSESPGALPESRLVRALVATGEFAITRPRSMGTRTSLPSSEAVSSTKVAKSSTTFD